MQSHLSSSGNNNPVDVVPPEFKNFFFEPPDFAQLDRAIALVQALEPTLQGKVAAYTSHLPTSPKLQYTPSGIASTSIDMRIVNLNPWCVAAWAVNAAVAESQSLSAPMTVDGLIIHELAHMLHTPMGDDAAVQRGDLEARRFETYNILEDGRIEKLMVENYPHALPALKGVNAGIFNALKIEPENSAGFFPCMAVRETMSEDLIKAAGDIFEHAHGKEAREKIEEIAAEYRGLGEFAPYTKKEKRSFKLAEEMDDLLNELMVEPPPSPGCSHAESGQQSQQQGQQQQGGGGSQQQQDQDGEGSEDSQQQQQQGGGGGAEGSEEGDESGEGGAQSAGGSEEGEEKDGGQDSQGAGGQGEDEGKDESEGSGGEGEENKDGSEEEESGGGRSEDGEEGDSEEKSGGQSQDGKDKEQKDGTDGSEDGEDGDDSAQNQNNQKNSQDSNEDGTDDSDTGDSTDGTGQTQDDSKSSDVSKGGADSKPDIKPIPQELIDQLLQAIEQAVASFELDPDIIDALNSDADITSAPKTDWTSHQISQTNPDETPENHSGQSSGILELDKWARIWLSKRNEIKRLLDEKTKVVRHLRRGRLDVKSVVRQAPAKGDKVFKQTRRTAHGHGKLEVVAAFDTSGSMSNESVVKLSEYMSYVKRICDDLGISCTVISWDSYPKVIYRPDNKVTAGVFRCPEDYGWGTEPEVGSKIAMETLNKSQMTHKLYLNMTDGHWGGEDLPVLANPNVDSTLVIYGLGYSDDNPPDMNVLQQYKGYKRVAFADTEEEIADRFVEAIYNCIKGTSLHSTSSR